MPKGRGFTAETDEEASARRPDGVPACIMAPLRSQCKPELSEPPPSDPIAVGGDFRQHQGPLDARIARPMKDRLV